jgi:GAF domain-containing protein
MSDDPDKRILEELKSTQEALAKHAERLRILHEIDQAVVAEKAPVAIAEAVVQPLRNLLGVPRAIVNIFDLEAGEVEWLAAAGRRRIHAGPGVRYPLRLMGDVDALRRGEPQLIDVDTLPPSPETQALLASGVHVYMVVPMIAGGELIGAVSFGGESRQFRVEQVGIATEVATQLAIAVAQARLSYLRHVRASAQPGSVSGNRGRPRHRAQGGGAPRWPNVGGVGARAGKRLPHRPPAAP